MRICTFTSVEKTSVNLSQAQRDKLTDADQKIKGNELAKWLAKNNVRKSVRAGMSGICNYDYVFPPPRFPRPPARPSKGKFLQWSVTGVNTLNANAWLRQHNHGWEFGERYLDMIIKEVQELAFKQYGSHLVKQFFRILTCHSEAQPSV